MIAQLLVLFVSLSAFIAGIFFAIHQNCVYTFRTFDLNFYSHFFQAKQTSKKESKNHKTIAKAWLKYAEQLRIGSVYSAFSVIYSLYGAIAFLVSFILYIRFNSIIWSVPFITGIIFLFFVGLSVYVRYKTFGGLRHLVRISWILGKRTRIFHHIIPWDEIQELRAEKEFCDYLEKEVPEHKDLLRLIEFSKDPSFQGIKCRNVER